MKIYLDNAATTAVKPEVLAAMRPYFGNEFGNASSIHHFGQTARKAVDESREILAKFFNCEFEEVIFTSGATEADNLAIQGIINGIIAKLPDKKLKPHIITSAFEHPAISQPIQYLVRQGIIEASFVQPKTNGIIKIEDIKKEIKPNTVLISIMYVNNEVGTIQPIREIGKMIEKENKTRELRIENRKSKIDSPFSIHHSPIFFHTDAVQAVEYQNCDLKYLHVDALSLSAHKIGGPKGVGALILKKNVPFQPLFFGGHHEIHHRAGTENVPGIVGLAKALEFSQLKRLKKLKQLKSLRDYFIKEILTKIPKTKLNGDQLLRSLNNVNIQFTGAEGESILLALDLEGIAVSTGSACASG